MEGKENISEELRLISGFVAGISRETPYGLPEGYFEGLAGKVLERVRAGDTVPGDVLNRTGEMLRELASAGSRESQDVTGPEAERPELWGKVSQEPVFSVPTGYFEGFAEKLMGRIKATESPLGQDLGPVEELTALSPFLSRIDKKMPFQVPEGYFNELPATTTAHIAGIAQDANASFAPLETRLSPLLAGLKNISVYQAPEGYFNELADTILEKVKQQDREKQDAPGKQPAPARVVSFGRRRNWLKYAAAAVVTGLVLTGGWLKLHNSPVTGPADITKSLSNVSDQEIESYLDNQNLPLADDLANSTASLDITESDVKSLLGDIPDGELKEYIDEHGDAKDLATN